MIAKIRSALPYIFLFFLAAVVLDLGNPLFDKPARDSGFFLYAGSQILSGKIPYLDFWDSKGPAIFFVNALGLGLGGGSRWGVWFVEFITVFGTLSILYRALSKRWGLGAALFGVALAGLGLRFGLGYGNYTEEYALLFNAAGLSLFLSMVDEKQNRWKYFLIGALFGVSFTFRANNIGGLFAIMIAVFLYDVFKRDLAEALKVISAILAGFSTPLLLWTLYFALLGGAWDMIYASVIFNFSYSSAKTRELGDLFGGFGKYGLSWYGWVTLAAWFFVVLRSLTSFAHRRLSFFETFLLLWFPIEILLSNLSGRNFTHYYISWALAIAVYCAFLFAHFWQFTFKVPAMHGLSDGLGAFISLALVILLLILFPSSIARYSETIHRSLNRTGSGMDYVGQIPAYIRDNTQPDDLVLTWYPDMGISFMAGRSSPIKYVYYPLFLEGSLTEEIESAYISDMITNRPELILDCSRGVDAIPSLDPATRQEQYSTPGVKRKMYIHPGMEQIFSFVSENYHIETIVDSCLVFRLNDQ